MADTLITRFYFLSFNELRVCLRYYMNSWNTRNERTMKDINGESISSVRS